MTPQRFVGIDFKEIRNLSITCKCGALFTVRLPQQNLREHAQCMGCDTPLWSGQEDRRYIRLLGLLRSISNWQDLQQDNLAVGFSIADPAETSR
jgi:hypothetical protein